ncbi:helix-turn-helix domain-containing protein [Alkalinema pantanalense CENA528]|uniref:helix-turn-helix domain-containing protein n=1 Tax=Alkalinema pantanalense TaxID=1620705 RepID=UPI003D6F76F7
MAKTNDALKILQKMTAGDSEMEAMIQESSFNAELAQLIYNARKQAGLTQKQLADRIGTKQSVIARLEDADYQGHSLSMLHKIAQALNQRLEVHLIPLTQQQSIDQQPA